MFVKNYKFQGVPSGDHESFCWDVTKETFITITGEEPDERWDKSYFYKGLYRLYPNDLYGFDNKHRYATTTITIEFGKKADGYVYDE